MASTHTIPVYSLVYNFWTLCIVSLSFYQWPPLSTFGQLTVPAGCSGMKLHVMQKKSSKLSLVVRSLLPVFQDQFASGLVHLCCSFYSQQSGSASKFTLFLDICHLSFYGAWYTECGENEISPVTCHTGSLPLHVCLTVVARAVFN